MNTLEKAISPKINSFKTTLVSYKCEQFRSVTNTDSFALLYRTARYHLRLPKTLLTEVNFHTSPLQMVWLGEHCQKKLPVASSFPSLMPHMSSPPLWRKQVSPQQLVGWPQTASEGQTECVIDRELWRTGPESGSQMVPCTESKG